MLFQQVIQLVQRVVGGLLSQRVFRVRGIGCGEGAGGLEGLGEGEDLGAEEGRFEVDYGGC